MTGGCTYSTDALDKEAAADAENTELEAKERRMRELLREEKRGKIKRRMLGNIRFIGELFKKRMLSGKIMHRCVMSLLNNGDITHPDEEDIEALVKLLTTVGKTLEAAVSHYVGRCLHDLVVAHVLCVCGVSLSSAKRTTSSRSRGTSS